MAVIASDKSRKKWVITSIRLSCKALHAICIFSGSFNTYSSNYRPNFRNLD